MNSNYITIQPVTIWTANGTKSATFFEVRYINFNGVTAVADTHLWAVDKDGNPEIEVGASLVKATEEQCANWGTDNVSFYKELAQNAGLSPV